MAAIVGIRHNPVTAAITFAFVKPAKPRNLQSSPALAASPDHPQCHVLKSTNLEIHPTNYLTFKTVADLLLPASAMVKWPWLSRSVEREFLEKRGDWWPASSLPRGLCGRGTTTPTMRTV